MKVGTFETMLVVFASGMTIAGGVRCSYVTWLSRGWCRAELWCRLLSIREDPSIIVLFSARDAEFMFPIAWQDQMGNSMWTDVLMCVCVQLTFVGPLLGGSLWTEINGPFEEHYS